jgi:hypothetical protein
MKPKKESLPWPADYEGPKIININTAFQQALGVTLCSPVGSGAGGASGSCSAGVDASGTPTDPNACSNGAAASVGPGKGNSPCGQGVSASA